jgi:uncharacterized lipoprotein YmbA
MSGRATPMAVIVPLVLAVVIPGCANLGSGTAKSRYYVLSPASPPAAQGAAAPAATLAAPGPIVGVGPVEIPGYLDRPQMVTRTESTEITLEEFHRWAEPLGDMTARVLAQDIALSLPGSRTLLHPWGAAETVDARVQVTILRLDGFKGKDAVLEAAWLLSRGKGAPLLVRRSVLTETIGPDTYEALVAAWSRALAALGKEIAAAVRDLPAAAGPAPAR